MRYPVAPHPGPEGNVTPHLTILAINAVLIGAAYGLIYPRLSPLTARRMMKADAVVTALAFGAAALLFAGRGLDFGIGPVPMSWWVFSLLSMLVIEAPVFWAFCRVNGVSLADIDAPARPPGR
ncbi:hypothetical protein N8I71_11995 [Roseibacterium sp. SDUM158016]|jgi:hypothetical protein|uniref:hypothetical protein n=1 Tax=Roseicyclus sediminis TaxID=2980997 RepID=UPI0021D1C71F|nr:hypothetical protein [Roseibacterium sp. SDUM158016]MCU4653556.1 hypothetical protein [Roseibacterium sp. SDUM158016]